MKHIYYKLLVPVIIVMVITGCKKSYSDLSQNSNKPTSAPPSLLLNGIANSMVDFPAGSFEIYSQYYLYNYDYYGNNRYDFGSGDNYYSTLENVVRMEQEALKLGLPSTNAYSALGKFFRAYFFIKMSMEQGDIPLTQALQGLNNLKPAYDPQKKVFQQAFLWLDSANAALASLISKQDANLAGDIFFNNDLKKWQKVVNTYRLRVLIHLSKKVTDGDLNVEVQFANIINNPTQFPIMQDATDNLQYVFVDPTNYYPDNANNFGQNGSRRNMSATHLGLLTQFNDPRTFVVAEPSRDLVDNQHQSPTAFSSFVGADAGLDLGIMYNNAGLLKYSFLNRKKYYIGYTAENAIQIGYPDMCFNIAEAINRGWVTGNAETWYMKGIKASMDFYGIPSSGGTFTAFFYRPGSSDVKNIANYDTYPINFDWNTYYNQASVKYNGNNATGLAQILQQKYLALFRQEGLESYYTYRRTGIPNFTTGPGTGNSNRIAMRFKYPSSEASANTTNYSAALQAQYSGNDDINGMMWLLK